jgi:hypothetical protein
LKRALILLFSLLPASLMLLSCGSYNSPTSAGGGSLTYRAFVTNNVTSGSGAAGVYIVNAQTDVRPLVNPIGAGNTPEMMVLTPNRTLTLVFSGNGTQFSDNQLTFISNATAADVAAVTLAGVTESIAVSPDSSASYVAVPVPSTPVVGQSGGVIDVVSLTSGTKTAEISCPPYKPNVMNPVCLPNPATQPPPSVCDVTPYVCGGFNPPYRFLSIGNTGTRLLAFSQGSDAVANAVAVITPSSVGTANPVVTFVSGSGLTAFDHPVWAFFNSDDTTAYVVNCGAECGGKQASVQKLDLTTSPPTPGETVPVPAATVALVNNSTMYLAGTPLPNPISQPCTDEKTQATSCGFLTVFDLSSMTVTNPPNCAPGTNCPAIITDGYHNRMALGANGQLFIGARTCTEIVPPVPPPPGAEVRGCLSIYDTNTLPGAVVIPPANGDVTGIEPIAKRTVVYVVEGGDVRIYDTATDALEFNPNNPNNPGQVLGLVGYFIDVKTIDF